MQFTLIYDKEKQQILIREAGIRECDYFSDDQLIVCLFQLYF